MIPDVLTVAWKEWKEYLLSGAGLKSGRLSLGIMVFVFGVMLPGQSGPEWLTSPALLVAWGWVPLMLVAGVVADSFAGERERHTLETLLASRLPDEAILFGKIVAAVVYAWSFVIVLLLVSLVTVNVMHWQGHLLLFPLPVLAGAVGFSLLTSVLAASAGVLVSLRASTARQAAQALSVGVLIVLFVPVFGIRALPEAARERIAQMFLGGGVIGLAVGVVVLLVAADVVLIAIAMIRFRRARLILD